MRSPLLAIVLVLSFGVAALSEQGTPTPAPGSAAASRAPRNAAEFDALFKQVSNWGRWGTEDQLGSATLVTEAKQKQAPGLVRSGISVSLAHNVLTEKAVDNPRLRDLPYLEPGTPIYVEDLEAWERKAGVKISSGDDGGRTESLGVHGDDRACSRDRRHGVSSQYARDVLRPVPIFRL